MEERTLTSREWAVWTILGDPYANVPRTLEELIARIETAIERYNGYRKIP